MIKRRQKKKGNVNITTIISKESKRKKIKKPLPSKVVEGSDTLKKEVTTHVDPFLKLSSDPSETTKKPDFFTQLSLTHTNRLKKHFKNPIDIDYNPSRCKDFHESGYCSWGPSCIYAHDRTSYKRGWELDKEWEDKQKEIKEKGIRSFINKKDKEEEKKEVNFEDSSCGICKQSKEDFVKTECGHVFCEECILKHYSKHKSCFLCKKKIKGNFVSLKKKANN